MDDMPLVTSSIRVSELLAKDRYRIPLYQRNFAWGDQQMEQLLRDIKENNNPEYYLGTLVVYEVTKNNKTVFEVIDGQQRLTAISIIYSVLSRMVPSSILFPMNLEFECREKSNSALRLLRERGDLEGRNDGSIDSILDAISTVKTFAKKELKAYCDDSEVAAFLKRFLDVSIFRVKLHNLTDKNHYFEVMNNRGEQLEAHEIVKVKLMERIDDKQEQSVFAKVWDACSDMNSRLETKLGSSLWGLKYEDDPLKDLRDFEDIKSKLMISEGSGSSPKKWSILEIRDYDKGNFKQDDGDEGLKEDEYESIIDFSNFLLQVLLVGGFSNHVRLDAGRFLLQEFGCVGEKQLPDPKAFLTSLLRLRVLFDKFIIKRKKVETNRGWRWVIERPKFTDQLYFVNTFDNNNQEIREDVDDSPRSKEMCMLQSMLFVSFRRDVYMNWLTTALRALVEKPDGSSLLNCLQDYSVSFLKESKEISQNEYNNNLAIHHYLFNFLDYHLWHLYYYREDQETYSKLFEMLENNQKGVKDAFNHFLFTRRNSIEHYLAQEKGDYLKIPKEIIDHFGNLALISRSLNSRLSNRDYREKQLYHDPKQPASLKYELMLSEEIWDEDKIVEHGKLMVQILHDKSEGYIQEL